MKLSNELFLDLALFARAQSGKIISYIWEYPVFIVPEIILYTKVNKQYAYEKIRELRRLGIVEKTKIKLDYPYKGIRGNKPTIHHLFNIQINDAEDYKVRQARARYWDDLKKYDPAIKENFEKINEYDRISRETVDIFKGKKRVGKERPSNREIQQFLRDKHPKLTGSQIAEITPKISHMLYKEGY